MCYQCTTQSPCMKNTVRPTIDIALQGYQKPHVVSNNKLTAFKCGHYTACMQTFVLFNYTYPLTCWRKNAPGMASEMIFCIFKLCLETSVYNLNCSNTNTKVQKLIRDCVLPLNQYKNNEDKVLAVCSYVTMLRPNWNELFFHDTECPYKMS